MSRLVELNRGPLVAAPTEVTELPAPPADSTVLDVRPVSAYLAGHRHGALNVPVSGTSFATKAGFLLDAESPIVVQAADRGEAERAIRGLRSIGFLELEGYVLGGGPEQMAAVSFDELDGLLKDGDRVRKGDLLVQIDTRDVRNQYDQVVADARSAKASAKSSNGCSRADRRCWRPAAARS